METPQQDNTAQAASPTDAQRHKDGFWEMLRTLAYAVAIAMVFRSLLFEPFHIPSGSMRMTLLEGDYIFVSKYSYGYSRYSFPFGTLFEGISGRLPDRAPKRGDVVVFRLPTNPKIDYIKRVMGLPGDHIQVRDGVVYINGEELKQKLVDKFSFEESGIKRTAMRYRETNPEGRTYYVLDENSFGEVDFTDEYVVPEGHYFMMGDNRDNSTDSRYLNEVGFVPAENLIGRAEVIFFSIDQDAQFKFWEFWKYPSMFRPHRFWVDIEKPV